VAVHFIDARHRARICATHWRSSGLAGRTALYSAPSGKQPVRAKLIFRNDINVICPVQPRLKKYTSSRETQITLTTRAIPSR
jgi:hypothetical protein